MLWILDGRTPKLAKDVIEWCAWFSTHEAERVVAQDEISPYCVRTVFTGVDPLGEVYRRPPRVFETVVFGPECAQHETPNRYSTWDAATTGHADIVQRLKATVKP